MKNIINKSWIAIFVLFVFVLVPGCGDNDKKKKESPAPSVAAEQAAATDIAVSVDGKILKKSELENNIKDRIKMFKDKIPADKQKEFQENMRKRLVEEFIMRTLFINEVSNKKIEVSYQ
jgi:peptidyl-prolyl cis-trans isomerase C